MSRLEELNRILRTLQSGTPDIEASALISDDGLIIASALPQHIEEIRVAGMSSTALVARPCAPPPSSARGALDAGDRPRRQRLRRSWSQGRAVDDAAPHADHASDAKLGLLFLDMPRGAAIRKVL
jgi:hypothetical protein